MPRNLAYLSLFLAEHCKYSESSLKNKIPIFVPSPKINAMELKEFISDVLTQIVEGAEQAQANVKKYGATVCPSGFVQISGDIPYGKTDPPYGEASPLTSVEFEVSLTSSGSAKSGAGLKVSFGPVGGELKSGKSEGETTVNRVRFSLPLELPSR